MKNSTAPSQVTIREVGLRDGLQSIARTLPTAHKLEWLRAAHAAGQREIEVGSFVPARLLPQLADTAELVAFAKTLPGLVDLGAGAQPQGRAGRDRQRRRLDAAAAVGQPCAQPGQPAQDARRGGGRDRAGPRGARRGRFEPAASRSACRTAFGCTIQGRVDEDEVLRLLQAVLDAGADQVGLADTVGYADPLQVTRLFEKCRAVAGDRLSCGHFHDTRGLGLANVFAAWQTGVRRFDACLGGIGGCPHAPGASGNVATEDVAYLMASMGVPTGLDFDALIALRAQRRPTGWRASRCTAPSRAPGCRRRCGAA